MRRTVVFIPGLEGRAVTRPKLGEMDTELFKEWFQAFAQSAGLTLHVENVYGENNHHIVDCRSCFKGLGTRLAAGDRDRPAPRRRGPLDQGQYLGGSR